MCNKAITENAIKLESVYDCYQNQEACNNAVDNHPHA